MPRDLYQEVTSTIIEAIEAGAGQWKMPWHSPNAGLPFNATTKASYNGVNILTLWRQAARKGYATSAWASYQQWQAVGAQVRAGEKGSTIVYAGTFTPKTDKPTESTGDSEPETRHFLKCSAVFNAAQVDGWQELAPTRPCLAQRIEHADAFVTATRADIRYGHERAFYSPDLDYVGMPDFAAFLDSDTASATENAYGTLLHELTHWTGHKTRCARDFGKRFGNDDYAAEELVAELGAAFLCAQLSITPKPRADHAQYLSHWLRVLKGDKRAIFTAAAAATKAADYLRGMQAKTESLAA